MKLSNKFMELIKNMQKPKYVTSRALERQQNEAIDAACDAFISDMSYVSKSVRENTK
jgi:hypothetical protein